MVGVPRSQGCKACRKKKKGCDLQRPQCGQCIKVGVECEYSQRQWTFISQDARTLVPATYSKQDIVQDSSLTCTALESQVLENFWARYLPQDPPDTVYLDVTVAPWCQAVQALSYQEDWVCLALKAVAFMALGRLARTPEYVRYARQLYVRSLRQTNKALQDPERMTSDATLANCKLLGIYEQFRLDENGNISTQGTDWQRHVEGTCRIMEVRGPQTVASTSGHALFQDAKAMAAISGLTRRRTPFFTSEEWRDIPWRYQIKSIRDQLFDIFIALPSLLQRQDRLTSAIDRSTTFHDASSLLDGMSLLKDFIELGTRLEVWERTLLLCAIHANTKTQEAYGRPPDTLLDICQCHGYGLFFLIAQFWTTALALSSSAHLTYQNLARCFPASKSCLSPIPPYLNTSTFASNIARTASHFFQPNAGLISIQNCTLPLGAALHFYAATRQWGSEEMKLLKSVLASEMSTAGMASDFLRSMAADAAACAPADVRRGDPRETGDHEKMAKEWFHATATRSALGRDGGAIDLGGG